MDLFLWASLRVSILLAVGGTHTTLSQLDDDDGTEKDGRTEEVRQVANDRLARIAASVSGWRSTVVPARSIAEEFAPHDEDINIMLPDLGISGGEGIWCVFIAGITRRGGGRERMERYWKFEETHSRVGKLHY